MGREHVAQELGRGGRAELLTQHRVASANKMVMFEQKRHKIVATPINDCGAPQTQREPVYEFNIAPKGNAHAGFMKAVRPHFSFQIKFL